jgi:cytochrome P450
MEGFSLINEPRPAQASFLATPPASPGLFSRLLSEQPLPALAARLGARIAAVWGRPIRVGGTVIIARHSQVLELLARDIEFRIGPINGTKIEAVNDGPFILGMDRDVALIHERRTLYEALAHVDLRPIKAAVAEQADAKINDAGEAIDVVGGYARPIAARTAQTLFGVRGPDDQTFMDVTRAMFAHTFLNLSDDKAVEKRALAAAELLQGWLVDHIKMRRDSGNLAADMMGALLDGGMDDDGVRRTLGGMLVGSVDTTASTVAKIVSMIGRDRVLAKSIGADVNDESRLAGWCWEALRRWPHNPILLRRAAAATRLGGAEIRAGDRVIAWTQAAMLDASAFPDPALLRPDRSPSAYLHFGGGLHPCAGRVVNAFQIPLLVGALVRRGIRTVGPIQWAGPFPDHLPLRFER